MIEPESGAFERGSGPMPYIVGISKTEVRRHLEIFGWELVFGCSHVTKAGKEIQMSKYRDPLSGELLVPSDALIRQLRRHEDGRKA
jgi:hypothetical protein